MTDEHKTRLPQCNFSGCTERSQTVVRHYDEDVGDRWLMEYCGPHAGFVVTHFPNNPKVLGPGALRQHWHAAMEALPK